MQQLLVKRSIFKGLYSAGNWGERHNREKCWNDSTLNEIDAISLLPFFVKRYFSM